jgi:two-component system phosphate regulon response regulator PhoB
MEPTTTPEIKPHILIIDDDPLTERLFGAKLAAAGFEIMYATNPEIGREMARRFQPALILLDVRMPNISGLTLAQRMHSEEPTKNIPIALLTNEDLSMEGENWVRNAWVKDYFHKSIDLNELVARVRKILHIEAPEGEGEKLFKDPKTPAQFH